MNNRLNNIFSETDCLTPGSLTAYAENRLSSDERHLVEKHLTDCEMCSEALEGLSSVKNKKELRKIFTGINKKIDQRVQKKAAKVFYFNFNPPTHKTAMRLAAAAILITVIGITFLFKYYMGEQKKDMMAQREVKESEISKQEKPALEENKKTVTIEEQKSKLPGNNEKNKSNVIKDAKENKSRNDITSRPKAVDKEPLKYDVDKQLNTFGGFIINETSNKNIETKEEDNVAYGGNATNNLNETPMADSISVSENFIETKTTHPATAYKNDLAKESGQAKLKKNKKSEIKDENAPVMSDISTGNIENKGGVSDQRYATAVKKYQSNDYTGSINLLESYISDNAGDYNALYYCGASYYFLNDYVNAIKYLDKVLMIKNGSYNETAQWYLALAYIGNKDKKKAEKILNEIIKANSSFKTQAEEKLLKIK